jgi:hypothetical protein
MFNDLQLKIGVVNYPDKGYSTTGARYLQEQSIVADLDGPLQATDSFTNSIVNSRNNPSTGERWNNGLSDDTDFMAMFETERGDAGYTFDGLNNTVGNVNTQIKGNSAHRGINQTYYYLDIRADGTVNPVVHPPSPQIWLRKDTY